MNKFRYQQIAEVSKRRRLEIVERLIASYYDGLSVHAQTEEAEWGDFSLEQLMNETD
jgi:hypothetical protein